MKKYVRAIIIVMLFVVNEQVLAQNIGINEDGSQPDVSAILDVKSTSMGMLIPRMSQAQREGISSPAKGLLVFQTGGKEGFYYYTGSAWQQLGDGGNTGGGTSDIPYASPGTENLYLGAIGNPAGNNNTTPQFNTAVGANAGVSLNGNNALNNVFLGGNAGASTTNAFGNTFIGEDAGERNTTGDENTFMGDDAGRASTVADRNTFIGYGAGNKSTTGIENVYLGANAGLDITTGTQNVFVGGFAGANSSRGGRNVFIGHRSGLVNGNGGVDPAGNNNVFIGASAGEANTVGFDNIFIGEGAGSKNTSGDNNTIIGQFAGNDNTTGAGNTFLGEGSGVANTTGTQNTFVGENTGQTNTTGSRNVMLGRQSHPNSPNLENSIAIGYLAEISKSNAMALGGIGGNAVDVGIGTNNPNQTLHVIGNVLANNFNLISDERWKKNIGKLDNSLRKVLELRGVRFNWRSEDYPTMKFDESTQIGFIAQEMEEVLPELVITNDDGYKTVKYQNLVAVLVEAIKEQQTIIDSQKASLSDVESRLQRLEKLLLSETNKKASASNR